MASSINDFAMKLRGLSCFGVNMTMQMKLIKHCRAGNVRAVRNYLTALRVAFPYRSLLDTIDDKLFGMVKTTIGPYYKINKSWSEDDDPMTLFLKVKEPPK